MSSFELTSHLQRSFCTIGAHIRAIRPLVPQRRRYGWPSSHPSRQINVRNETFELILPVETRAIVLDCRKAERHLVLSIQAQGSAPERFLCGFDERHWFVAAVTGQTVASAKRSLMPEPVRVAAFRAGLRHSDFHRRRTTAFVRQGEWFFVPDESVSQPLLVHRSEPLIRPGGGKAHIVDELARGKGEMVWHHRRHASSGISETRYHNLLDHIRAETGWRFMMRIGADVPVHARGAVHHPDHATIHLPTWHRVYINSEKRPDSLGFLD